MPPPPPTPEDRLAAARAGSNEALGELLEAYRRYLLRVARKLMDHRLSSKGGESDLVQETFQEAHRDFLRFHGSTEAELLAWLRLVLSRHVLRFARQYRDTQKRAAGREITLDPVAQEGATDPALWAGGPTASGQLMAGERSVALQAALARLPDDYRRVILMRHQTELSFDQIGAAIGRSPEAARKLWVRAVERLHEDLEGV